MRERVTRPGLATGAGAAAGLLGAGLLDLVLFIDLSSVSGLDRPSGLTQS